MQLQDVSKNYDHAARYYDGLTCFVFQSVLRVEDKYRLKAVSLLEDINGKRVLDIGCGTGRNFPLLVAAVGEQGEIIGLDYSEGMLSEAQALIDKEEWHNITLVRGDAVALEGIGESSFDAIISTWCLGIVHDLEAALKQALSKLEPGGRISIMDFQRACPDTGPLRWLYPVYSKILQYTGIDSPEDLDDDLLRAKWARGQQLLERVLF